MFKQTTVGYVLHSRPYQESSLLVDVFGQKVGRFSLLAKGIKRKTAQSQRATLQPFSQLKIEYSGKSALKVLCQVEPVKISAPIQGRALACGYYINELLIRALQEWQEMPELFEHYRNAISQLNNALSLSQVLRNFEVDLLSELGVAPDWRFDIQGDEITNHHDYFFNIDHGFEKVEPTTIIQQTNKRFSGAAILALAERKLFKDVEKQCQQITQMLLRQIIGQKPLESRKLWV
jgi:DNA repair protein RecO (recombination protein O)